MRLIGGLNEYEGTVEVCLNQVWGSVCSSSFTYSNFWNVQEGQVVCGQLGYQRLGLSLMFQLHALTYFVLQVPLSFQPPLLVKARGCYS